MENNNDTGEEQNSYEYSDHTMSTGQTGEMSSCETDLGDTDASL